MFFIVSYPWPVASAHVQLDQIRRQQMPPHTTPRGNKPRSEPHARTTQTVHPTALWLRRALAHAGRAWAAAAGLSPDHW